MAIKQGTLAIGQLAPGGDKQIYQCVAPASSAGFSINFCNDSEAPAKLTLSYGPATTMDGAGNARLVKKLEIAAGETWERTGLAIGVGVSVWMRTTGATLDYAVYGWEKP